MIIMMGGHWKDKDPRENGRTVTVLEATNEFVYVISSRGKRSRIERGRFVKAFEPEAVENFPPEKTAKQ